MTIAVTGAAGFIGRHVMKALNDRGMEPVACLRPNGSELPSDIKAKRVFIDIHNPPEDLYARLHRPEQLIHLAWGSLDSFKSDDHLTRELPAHRKFLNKAVAAGLPHLVVIGTCLEYGLQSGELAPDMTTEPTTPYGQAKDQLHADLQALQSDHHFELSWGRLFYLFGPGQPPRTIRSLLEAAITRGDESFPMSGGQQVRDYLPVEAVAEQIVDLALARSGSGAVNICSGQGITIQRLVENWIDEMGWSIKLDLGKYPYPDYEPMAFWGKPHNRSAKP